MPPVLWQPAADARTTTRVGEFMTFCEARTGLTFDDYDALWRWSTGAGLEQFWSAVWDYGTERAPGGVLPPGSPPLLSAARRYG